MATTGQSFVKLTNPQLVGSTVQAAGQVVALNPSNANQVVNGGSGISIDKAFFDFSTDAFAKHGFNSTNLTGTTPVTLSLIDLTSGSTSFAGDTVFATWNKLMLYNTGAADLTVGPAGSNPARLQLNGTTPTITVAAGSHVTLESVAGLAVDSTHFALTVTPTAGGSFALGVAGS